MSTAIESSRVPGAKRTRIFNAYRITAVVLAVYCAGHTLGAVLNTPSLGPESDKVVALMKSVHLMAQGAPVTWYGFYRGFGAFVSIHFLFLMVLCWFLGGLEVEKRRELAVISWSLLASAAAGTAIAFAWFFPVPMVFSSAVTLLLAIACITDLGNKSSRP